MIEEHKIPDILKFLYLTCFLDILTTAVILFTGGYEVGTIYVLLGATDFKSVVFVHVLMTWAIAFIYEYCIKIRLDFSLFVEGLSIVWLLGFCLNTIAITIHFWMVLL